MRFLQNLIIILLLATGVPMLAQESTAEADNVRAWAVLQNLADVGRYTDLDQLTEAWLEILSQ